MKICLINTTQFWGGGEKWFFENAINLSKSGFQVFVLAHKNGSLWQRLQSFKNIVLNHLEVKNLSFFNVKKKQALKSFFSRNEIETVIINASPEVKLCAPAAKNAGVSHVVYRRGSAIPIKNTLLNSWMFGNVVTHIIANSNATKETFLKHLGGTVPNDKVAVISNGIELPQKDYSKSKGVFTIGSLGRLTHQKGYELALEVAVQLKKKGLDFTWLIAGDGPQREDITEKINQLNLKAEVILLGEIRDIAAFFKSIDLYVHPARWEGFGYAIAEAMAHKKAVIAFDISSNPELVEHGKTGLLAPFLDVDTMTQQIRTVFKNHDLLQEMGQNGFNEISKNFTQTAQFNKLVSFLKSL